MFTFQNYAGYQYNILHNTKYMHFIVPRLWRGTERKWGHQLKCSCGHLIKRGWLLGLGGNSRSRLKRKYCKVKFKFVSPNVFPKSISKYKYQWWVLDFQTCESDIHQKKKHKRNISGRVVLLRECNLVKVSNCQLRFLYLAKLSFKKNQQRNRHFKTSTK